MGVYNPAGAYRGKIGMAVLSEAANERKTPQFELHLELEAVYDQDKRTWYEHGQPRFAPVVYLSLTEATMGTPDNPGWVANVLSYLNFNGDFDAIAQLEGKEVEFYCQHQDVQDKPGEKREKWSISIPKVPKPPAPKTVTKSLKTQYGNLFRQNKPAPARPPARPQPAPVANGVPSTPPYEPDPIDGGPPVEGEDIPF